MADKDAIWLIGVDCRVRLGVPDWERNKPQKVMIDIGMETSLTRAGRTDRVKDTVDYWMIEKEVRRIAQTGESRLAEHLAWKVAQRVLRLDRRLRRVHVAVHKRPAVMPRTREVVISMCARRK